MHYHIHLITTAFMLLSTAVFSAATPEAAAVNPPNEQSPKPPQGFVLYRVVVYPYSPEGSYMIKLHGKVDNPTGEGSDGFEVNYSVPYYSRARARVRNQLIQRVVIGTFSGTVLPMDIFLVDFQNMLNFTLAIREPGNEDGPTWTWNLAGLLVENLHIPDTASNPELFPPWNVVPAGTIVEPWSPSST